MNLFASQSDETDAMKPWKILALAGALVVVFVLIVGIERQRNCRYADGTHCALFGTSPSKYGGPQ